MLQRSWIGRSGPVIESCWQNRVCRGRGIFQPLRHLIHTLGITQSGRASWSSGFIEADRTVSLWGRRRRSNSISFRRPPTSKSASPDLICVIKFTISSSGTSCRLRRNPSMTFSSFLLLGSFGERSSSQTSSTSCVKPELLQHLQGAVEQNSQHLQGMDARLGHLGTATARRSLQPRVDGYLAEPCPAPLGWAQKDYHCYLIWGAWLYIAGLGLPDDGFDLDEDAFELARKNFPCFAQHFLEALNHEHVRIYNRSFQYSRGEE
ncbi:hypothetical protein PG996_012607 [Apiospora saccharicola]|uniref:Uncharacterized protein n=1 Tax=Apiospora saccharicola TaxID=335842 RepID=A0ABR1U333_9PEZI